MSVHDETWDRCPHCRNVVKTWHGDFHSGKWCVIMSFADYEKSQSDILKVIKSAQKIPKPTQSNDFLRVIN